MSSDDRSERPGLRRRAADDRLRDENDQSIVVAITGEVDVMTAPRLHDALTAALREADGRPVVVDLSRVELLSSAGLTAMSRARQLAAALEEPLRLVVDHARPVIRPLHMTGMDHWFDLYHTVGEALAHRAP